ncbi:MAG: hypothetical protein F4121_09205 [Acidimicrobiia bacterium]|nr:hypothetical protein [Acidimicrobiia bacterium]MYC45365.1 hypothetical protein [Acidimicrobiia bacterium]MYI20226.1 hypothetical protein [Acidimicrobiia bacterium]
MLSGTSDRPTRGERLAPDERGLITLDWLLFVFAATLIGALTAIAAQRLVEEETIRPADAAVRLIEADIEAAFVESAARAEALRVVAAGGTDLLAVNEVFGSLCERIDDRDSVGAYGDVVEAASWVWDPTWQPGSIDTESPAALIGANPGECIVRPCAVPFRSPCVAAASLAR